MISRSSQILAAIAGIAFSLPAQNAEAEGPPLPRTEPKYGGGNDWFKSTDVDLGTFLEGERAVGKLKFENPREETHRLKNFQPSCACAKAIIHVGDRFYRLENEPTPNSIYRVDVIDGVEQKELVKFVQVGSGESGSIEVHLDLRGVNGKKEATVNFQSSDEKLPQFVLKCTATASQYFNVVPPEINLNKMTWQDKREFTAQITSPVQPDFEITGHDPLPDQMTVSYEKEMRDGKAIWRLHGTYGPNVDPRAGGGIIELRTNIQNKKVQVRVLAWVDGPLKVNPGSFLALGLIRKGKGASRTIEFVPTDEFQLEIQSFEIQNLSVDKKFVDVKTSRDGNTAKLELSISPDAPKRLIRGDITVRLNHPAAPEKEIQFNGFVR